MLVDRVASEGKSVSSSSTARASTMRDGFRVLGVAIRKEPWVFAASTLGSILFGALTVADAWVLGWSTEPAIIHAFETGEIDDPTLGAVLGPFVGVALNWKGG